MLRVNIKSQDCDINREARMRKATDGELVSLIITKRDKRAMKEVYMRHVSIVSSLARKYLTNPAHCEDVVHDTMIALWGLSDTARAPNKLLPWLAATAKFKAIDRNRRADRWQDTTDPMLIPDQPAQPNELMEQKSESQLVSQLVKTLNQKQRRVIEMFYFQGLSCFEIAAIEGCPAGTVKSRLHHARESLGTKLRLH